MPPGKMPGKDAWEGEGSVIEDLPETQFLGYEETECDAQILGIVRDRRTGGKRQRRRRSHLIFDRTVLYAESGGQVGDRGTIQMGEAAADVHDTQKNHAKVYMHKATVTAGTLNVGNTVHVMVDIIRRRYTMRNHTAAHLLQAALRKVLGTHVETGRAVGHAGTCAVWTLRIFSAMTKEELAAVEALVNNEILKAVPVETKEMPIEEAKKLGAMALFGEKYGDIVRVVSVQMGSPANCAAARIWTTTRPGWAFSKL